MKKITLFILAAVAMVFAGCKNYDSDIDDINARLSKLEAWQAMVNTNISSLQTIVLALQGKDYVTSVVALSDGSGYQISFQNSGTITIKNGINGINGTNGTNGINGTNGTNGKDAITPIIGVKLHTDGFYYWTIDTGDGKGAQWLKDSSGNMIRTTGDKGDTGATGATGATGTAGKDATAPQVRINTDKESDNYDMWEISTDGGTTWTSTGVKATGDQGDTGVAGYSVFAENGVKINSSNVTFTLIDGTTTFSIPIYQEMKVEPENISIVLPIVKDTMDLSLKLPDGLKRTDISSIYAEIKCINGTIADIQTRIASSKNLWGVSVLMPTAKTDTTYNDDAKIRVMRPDSIQEGKNITALLLVTLSKTDGTVLTASRTIRYSSSTFDGIGKGTKTDPYLITSAEQLKDMSTELATNGIGRISHKHYFKMMNDIDLSSVCGDGKNRTVNANWVPIGASEVKSFQAHFDGGGYKITNLYINASSSNYQALFGTVESAIIENLSVYGKIIGKEEAAGIVAYDIDSYIKGCSFYGSVKGTNTVAGIVAYMFNQDQGTGQIVGCYNMGSISGTKEVAGIGGAIVMYNSTTTGVQGCYNAGTISGVTDSGPIVGYIDGTISGCYFSSSGNSSIATWVSQSNLNSSTTVNALNAAIESYNTNFSFEVCNFRFAVDTSNKNNGYPYLVLK
jgi:hypothetical protein